MAVLTIPFVRFVDINFFIPINVLGYNAPHQTMPFMLLEVMRCGLNISFLCGQASRWQLLKSRICPPGWLLCVRFVIVSVNGCSIPSDKSKEDEDGMG